MRRLPVAFGLILGLILGLTLGLTLEVTLGLIGLASRAYAADYGLPVLRPSSTFVPASPTYFRWEGPYVGGQLTYGNANADFTTATQQPIAFSLRQTALQAQAMPSTWQVLGPVDTGSAGFGAFAGYNMQWADAIVGLEFNYTHSSFNAIASSSPLERVVGVNGNTYDVFLTASGSMQVQDFATLRARFGWAIDHFMPYVTLGLAGGRADMALSTTVSGTQTGPNPNPPPAILVVPFSFTDGRAKNSAFLLGYAGGAGLEVALTRSVFARAEYEYIQWSPLWQISSHLHMGRVGVGFKF
jgi:outer membrane immunogenic protein